MLYATYVKILGGFLAAVSVVCAVLMIIYGFDGGLLTGVLVPAALALVCWYMHRYAAELDNLENFISPESSSA
jgi:hypothetical protein